MQPTNFSRKFLLEKKTFCRADMPWVDGVSEVISISIKFVLPDGGIILEDKEFRGLARESLRLPFPCISLEFRHDDFNVIVPALEFENVIVVSLVVFDKIKSEWMCFPPISIKKDDWLYLEDDPPTPKIFLPDKYFGDEESCTWSDVVMKLLYFLNATSCSNVQVEKIGKSNKSAKTCIKFDEYHVLTIGNRKSNSKTLSNLEKRSPREHLRRGHIRILHSGCRVWVNSCVVSKGSKGRIFKDYKVKFN